MKTNRFLSLATVSAIIFTFFACSGDDSPSEPPPGGELSSSEGNGELVSSSSGAPEIFGYCDYGPIGPSGGGCYPMTTDDDAANCAAWGQVVSSCPATPSSSSNIPPPPPLSSSVTPPPPSSSSTAPPPPPSSSSIVFGSLVDTRDNHVYRTVKIGNQWWMAENMNIESYIQGVLMLLGGSCYDNLPANCNSLGRLYTWAEAMRLSSTCNTSDCASQIKTKHTGICPNGWHIPSYDDWNVLMVAIGNSATGGKKLKAKNGGWENYNGQSGNGTDEYGFGALAGGYRSFGGGNNFTGMYYNSYWWSANQGTSTNTTAYHASMSGSDDKVGWLDGVKQEMNYVRCVMD